MSMPKKSFFILSLVGQRQVLIFGRKFQVIPA